VVISCYASPETVSNIRANFRYIFDNSYTAGGKPKLELIPVTEDFLFHGVRIIPVEICHDNLKIFGYRVGKLAYLTDCSSIPEESFKKLKDLDLLIISALRYTPHPAHLSVEQAIQVICKIKPKLAIFTHMGHEIDYDGLSRQLPEGIMPAYDGMEFKLDEP
jgi:phosphoribosyl 1,2-cyclic phosphate phosphodiesterase